MDGRSLNITQVQIDKLKALFPEAVSEGKVDWERLKLTLGEDIALSNERYVLNWAGKSDAFRALQAPTSKTLTPAKDESVDWDTTQNIFIEGENLEVLKVLQKSYFGQVKMIYIDPPYNTGNDSFIYPDRFSETKDDYLRRVGDKDEEGHLTREGLFSKNSKENGQYHSNWLSMMYPRLFLAKNLLRQDGVIFVSIDNNEVHNLRLVMNEVFGEENFVECISWNKRIPKNDKGIGNIHEFILLYAKDITFKHEFLMRKEGLDEIADLLNKLKRKNVPLPEAEIELEKLYEKKAYDRGITLYNSLNYEYRPWGKINMSWPNADTFGPRYPIYHPKTKLEVAVPDRGWRWKQETFNDAVDYKNVIELHDGTFLCGRIWFAEDEKTQPSSVLYLDEVDSILLRSILSLKSDGGIQIENLFEGKSYFSYPKPTSIIQTLVGSLSTKKDDLILDFFAGSGTTAHAVMQLNAEDGGNRKYICVQLPEPCDEKSEAAKAGYGTIAEISKERIRRAGKKVRAEIAATIAKKEAEIAKLEKELKLEGTEDAINNLQLSINNLKAQDTGFKVLKLTESNFKQWRKLGIGDAEELERQMALFIDPVKEGATEERMVYELLLKSGLGLNSSVERVTSGPSLRGTKQSHPQVTSDERRVTSEIAAKGLAMTGGEIASAKSLEMTGAGYHVINNGELVLLLEKAEKDELAALVAEVVKLKPRKVVALDRLFEGNDQLKTNTMLQMKDAGVEFRTI